MVLAVDLICQKVSKTTLRNKKQTCTNVLPFSFTPFWSNAQKCWHWYTAPATTTTTVAPTTTTEVVTTEAATRPSYKAQV